jgi:hypothetical protein
MFSAAYLVELLRQVLDVLILVLNNPLQLPDPLLLLVKLDLQTGTHIRAKVSTG